MADSQGGISIRHSVPERSARWRRVVVLVLAGALCAAAGPTDAAVRAAKPTGASAVGLWQPPAIGLRGAVQAPVTPDGGWRLEQPVDATAVPNAILLGVACQRDGQCHAVGSAHDRYGTVTAFAVRRAAAGSEWSAERIPAPGGAVWSQLYGVSCGAADSCLAVGYSVAADGSNHPLAEVWDGHRWRLSPAPSPAGATAAGFFAVSCASARECTAVGDYNAASGGSQPLVERLRHGAWSLGAVPTPPGAIGTALFGVSCATPARCTAVGSYRDASDVNKPLAEAGSGGAWSITPTPSPPGALDSDLYSVSCPTADFCLAVGLSLAPTPALLAYSWDGTQWSTLTPTEPAGAIGTQFTSVACPAAGVCIAVGDSSTVGTSTIGTPLVESWAAGRWTVQPAPARAVLSQFKAVSCPADACTAVGEAIDSGPVFTPLAEAQGVEGWAIQKTPAPYGATTTDLLGVSCPDRRSCIAVGLGTPLPLAESWDGRSWRLMRTAAPPGASYAQFHNISCTARDFCMAVGAYNHSGDNGAAGVPLAEIWNGANWRLAIPPTPTDAQYSALGSVSCTAPNACMAVGSYSVATGESRPMAQIWNGHAWSILAVPTPAGATGTPLSSVSCTAAADDCHAVGWSSDDFGGQQVIALAWDGSRWTAQAVPTLSGPVLSAVSCPAVDACTAVGNYVDATRGVKSLVLVLHGGTWTMQPSASPSPVAELSLLGLSCRDTGDCTAVGAYETKDFTTITAFAETSTGGHWSVQRVPVPAGGHPSYSFLHAVSCTMGRCTATGFYFGYSGTQLALAVAQG